MTPTWGGSVRNLSAYLSAVSALFALTGCEKFALDRQMEELCEQDGGIKVYETIALPVSKFDQWGDPFPGWRGRPRESRFGADFSYVVETTYLKKGEPLQGSGRLDRTTEKIFRVSDGKLIGQATSYGRSGGDFIAFSHPTSKSCPENQSESDLIRSVFLRTGG